MTDRFPIPSRLLAAAAVLAALAMPSAAQAWWRGGLFFGFPPFAPYVYAPPPIVYGPPPMVYAPPVYAPPGYPPPPGYQSAPTYAPPAQAGQGQPGQACYAGAYVCPLDAPLPAGAACSCPTNTGRAGGRVG